MRQTLLIFCAVWVSAVNARAQSGIEVPAIGAIVDPSGALRRVQGIAGNFLLGPATLWGVLSAACSDRLCLAKTDSKIFSPTGEIEAPRGPAIIALNGLEAIVFFPESRTFVRWHEGVTDPLDWKVDGEVLAIHGTEIALRRDGSVWIVHPDDSVIDWIADTAGPVLLLAEGVLFATPDELVLRHRDGTEKRFGLTGAETIAAMGPHYATIRTSDAIYALRTEPGREKLFLLPGNSP